VTEGEGSGFRRDAVALATRFLFEARHLAMYGYETPERSLILSSPIRTIFHAHLDGAQKARGETKTMSLRTLSSFLAHMIDQITLN
jgi:hypothetical protein